MTEFLIDILLVCCLLIFAWGLKRRSRMIQYPFLIAAVYLGWVVPQLLGLTHNRYLPPGALAKTTFMATLCLAAVYFGYTTNRRAARLFQWQFDERRLLKGAAALSVLGAFFFFKSSALAAEASAEYGGAWTGPITIYVFLARLLSIGMVIAIVLHLIRPRWQTLAIVGFDLLFYLDRIVIHGRRADMAELALIGLLALWFQRRWLPPRGIVMVGLIAGALLVNSIGDYRATMLREDRATWSGAGMQSIMEIDFVGNLQKIVAGEIMGGELQNAAMNIEAIDQLLVLDYWLTLWNQFVHDFVPGQLVGFEVKQSLTLDFDNDAQAYFGYVPWPGTTLTGFSDAFQSFWYLGAIKFFLAGLIMSRWYRASVSGNIAAQMIVMLVVAASLHLVTHSTGHFYMSFVPLAAFLLPVLLFARIKPVRAGAALSNPGTGPMFSRRVG